MNQIIIKGRLTADPETETTQNGKLVAAFTVAVNRRFKTDKTDFFRVNAWEKTGEFVSKYFSKGKEILVRGEMQATQYDDKQGNKRTAWEIVAEQVDFCGPSGANGAAKPAFEAAFEDCGDAALPF